MLPAALCSLMTTLQLTTKNQNMYKILCLMPWVAPVRRLGIRYEFYLILECLNTGTQVERKIHKNQFETFKKAGIPVV